MTENTKDLLAIKVSVNPQITHESVQKHLDQVITGIAVPLDDDSLREMTDIPRLKKVYKIGGLDHDRKEMEAVIIGMMALRGAT